MINKKNTEPAILRFVKLNLKDELRLIHFLQIAKQMNNENLSVLEETYLDTNEFRFIKDFLPQKADMPKYKQELSDLLTACELSYKKTTGKDLKESQFVNGKNIFSHSTQSGQTDVFTVKDFLEQAVQLKSVEEYNQLYKKVSFTPVKIGYLSPKKSGIYYPDSMLPVHIMGITDENLVEQYTYALNNQCDPVKIPTPNKIKKNGLAILKTKLEELNNNLNLEYRKMEQNNAATYESLDREPIQESETQKKVPASTQDEVFTLKKEKYAAFIQNYNKPGCEVPSFGLRNEITNHIDIFSGYSFSHEIKKEQAVILVKTLKNGDRVTATIPEKAYANIVENANIIASAPVLTTEVIDKYNENANLDENKQRLNTAANFWHNYRAYCRSHCSNQVEAIEAAKKIIQEMQFEEQVKIKGQILQYQKLTGESYNDRILSFYRDSVSNLAIRNTSAFDEKTLVTIKHYTDVNTIVGSKLDSDCKIKIGDTIKMNIDCKDLFNESVVKSPAQELTLVSSCKENNTVVLIDKKQTSKFVMNRDEFIQKVQKIERKQLKYEKKHARDEYVLAY